jgi:hypothetical protein
VNLRTITVFFWAFLIASAAIAGEKHETRIKIVTDDTETGTFEWHSSDADGDFSDLEVGESKTLAGEGGKEVTVTRTEKGLTFDIDGKTVEMMDVGGDGEHMIHKDGNVVIKEMKNVRVIKTDDAADVTIISSDEIDQETRARIEAALREAGKDGEVLFLDGSDLHEDAQAHGEHDVRIIKKKVEKTN